MKIFLKERYVASCRSQILLLTVDKMPLGDFIQKTRKNEMNGEGNKLLLVIMNVFIIDYL